MSRGWSLTVIATPVLWLRDRSGRSDLLVLGWPLDIRLPRTSHLGPVLPSPLSGCGRLPLKVLADRLVARLVAVTLAAQLVLLLHLAGIPVSRILPLVDWQRGAGRY